MSRVIKIGAAGVIGFMTATSVFALTTAEAMDEFDLLTISEAPLTETELGEARGGFSFGGFDFKFGIEITPIAVENPLSSSGVFGDEGLFSDGGVFGNDGGPLGQDGVFGGSGVFGANNASSNSGQSSVAGASPFEAPTTQSAAFVNTLPGPTEVASQQANVAASGASAPQVQAPIAQPTSVPVIAVAAVSDTASVLLGQAPSQIVANVIAETIPQAGVASVAGDIVGIATSGEVTPTEIILAAVTPTVQKPTSSSPSSPSSPTQNIAQQAAPSEEIVSTQSSSGPSVQRTITQRITQTATMRGRTFIIDNNINGAKFTQIIDINIAIPNFDSRINRAIADAAVATIASSSFLLGQILN